MSHLLSFTPIAKDDSRDRRSPAGGALLPRFERGGLATGTVISHWTLAFAMFLFVSIALMKRYAELRMLASMVMPPPIAEVTGWRIYRPSRVWVVLFAISAVVMLWIMRLWLLTSRGEMNEDPVLFAVKERWSVGLLFGAGAILAGAI